MSPLPSVDAVLRLPHAGDLAHLHGRAALTDAVRSVLARSRERGLTERRERGLTERRERGLTERRDEAAVLAEAAALLDDRARPRLRRVFNLTGTVLHTNLGRALLSEAAAEQASMAMRQPCALEFDLASGGRGDRDNLIEGLLCELTGAEAATVVNNNAAAVLLTLAALAARREVLVSRGELVEIGGAFRIPDVMRAAHAKLIEVGTTNRTHPRDFEEAIGPRTAALMKVHASNYTITGFTAAVDGAALARIAHAHGLPFITDLGAGSLIDMATLGLPREPVVRDCIAAGADVVMFSGDKLMGGPQCGLIVGRKDLIAKIAKHPLKRALRVSKVTLAALEATLLAYRKPDLLSRDLPTLRLLTRTVAELAAAAARLQDPVAQALGGNWSVTPVAVTAQAGSGSLADASIPSLALSLRPLARSGKALTALAARLRGLPIPVIGRIAKGALLLDLRCLDDEAGFVGQLDRLSLS